MLSTFFCIFYSLSSLCPFTCPFPFWSSLRQQDASSHFVWSCFRFYLYTVRTCLLTHHTTGRAQCQWASLFSVRSEQRSGRLAPGSGRSGVTALNSHTRCTQSLEKCVFFFFLEDIITDFIARLLHFHCHLLSFLYGILMSEFLDSQFRTWN